MRILLHIQTFAGIFEDDEVTHIEGDVNPVRDMEIIHEELRLKDLEYLDKTVEHMERTVLRGGDKTRKNEYVRILSLLNLERAFFEEIFLSHFLMLTFTSSTVVMNSGHLFVEKCLICKPLSTAFCFPDF
jgi:ribosome-binding ATPase YchF (GTP1/OBG family)